MTATNFLLQHGILHGGSSFLPTDIANLVLWLDANDLTTLFQDAAGTTPATDTSVVGHWADKSDQGNNVTQSTTAFKPTYLTGIENGLPVIRFDGSDDRLASAAFAGGNLTQPTHIFAVAKISAIDGQRFLYDGIGASNRNAIFSLSAGGDKWAIFSGASVNDTTATTDLLLFEALFNGASSTLTVNGTPFVSGDPGAQVLSGITVGASHSGAVPWIGDVDEVMVYDAEISAVNIAKIETYVADKWAAAIV